MTCRHVRCIAFLACFLACFLGMYDPAWLTPTCWKCGQLLEDEGTE